IAPIDDVDVSFRWNAEHRNERGHRRGTDSADYFVIGRIQGAVMRGDGLGTGERLGSRQTAGMVQAVERVPTDHVRKLVDEKWWNSANPVAHELDVSCL